MRETFGMTGKTQKYLDILGIATLDYIELYKKFTYTNQESYRRRYDSWFVYVNFLYSSM